jgi:SAM-dependent methyltransferase
LPQEFIEKLWALEALYLKHDNPLRRCGFEGGPKRWKAERGPIVQAIDRDGTFMDVGCANGYLLESLAAWVTLEKRWHIVPYGVDINAGLIVEAMRRWSGVADHFWTANAWEFAPPLKFDFVYSTTDCVPRDFLPSYVARLLDRYVKPGGRLIIGSYGDMLWERDPLDVGDVLSDYGFPVAGRMQGGKMLRNDGPVARFAWVAN